MSGTHCANVVYAMGVYVTVHAFIKAGESCAKLRKNIELSAMLTHQNAGSIIFWVGASNTEGKVL